jgi:hypothetical protein
METTSANGLVELVVKSPTRPETATFRMKAARHETVGQIKSRLHSLYPGGPQPDHVTVSHFGSLPRLGCT